MISLSTSVVHQWKAVVRSNRRWCKTGVPSKKLLFDGHTKALQKARASLAFNAEKYDYLRDHMATVTVDRLHDISRTFHDGLDLFCGSAHVLRALRAEENNGEGRISKENKNIKIGRLRHADVHDAVLRRARQHFDGQIAREDDSFIFSELDNDDNLPITEGTLDIVISAGGGLHWVNDLPKVLQLIRRLLKPDGLFLGTILGGDTLHELRVSLQLAEEEMRQRLAPRISPMVRLSDVANLISSAGFTLPTVDVERVVVTYSDMHTLMEHLRGMGETNALFAREIHYGRETFRRAAEIYDSRFGVTEKDVEARRIPATFEIMHMIGWGPSAMQQQPLQRGSAGVSLTELAKNLPSTDTSK